VGLCVADGGCVRRVAEGVSAEGRRVCPLRGGRCVRWAAEDVSAEGYTPASSFTHHLTTLAALTLDGAGGVGSLVKSFL
jgi:hypothetical protein